MGLHMGLSEFEISIWLLNTSYSTRAHAPRCNVHIYANKTNIGAATL